MTKEEAIQSMKKGNKLRHWLFSNTEFIQIKNGKLLDENDYVMGDEFWKLRTAKHFDDGWEVWEDV